MAKKKKKGSLFSPGTIMGIIGIVLLIIFVGLYGETVMSMLFTSDTEEKSVELSLEDEAFLDKLLEEWSQDFRLTTIHQVARSEGREYDHDFRLKFAYYLASHKTLHKQLISWRAPTFVFTNDEKRVAKYILIRSEEGDELPSTEEIQKAVKLDDEAIDEALFILYQFGFLDQEKRFKYFPGPYKLSADHDEKVPWWSLQYVELVREDGSSFNVQCILDAVKLIYEDFIGEKIEIRTYCPDCLQNIRITADMGEITSLEPQTARVLKGGNCPTNLMFVNPGHADRWLEDHPEIKDRNLYGILDLLDQIREQR